nr:reverse transcriptase domain-containing protein [Tanacetum cinerariifolium]
LYTSSLLNAACKKYLDLLKKGSMRGVTAPIFLVPEGAKDFVAYCDALHKGLAGSESRLPMLNKENYVPWSSRLLWYAKSRPNGKLIYNSILNGPYVRRMIPEPGDSERDVNVNETFHEQTNDELSERELK